METQFNGTLVAPNASVAFGINFGVQYQGSFYARNIEVRPGSSLVCDEGPTPPLPTSPVPGSCSNGVKDGSETDVDCGGLVCAACVNGRVCRVNGDCQSGDCQSGVCQILAGQVDATLKVFADWGSGYCVDILLTNNAPQPTKTWSVTVNTGQSTIYDTWNGNFSSTSGAVNITPAFAWNEVVASSGRDNSIGFCANRTPANSGAFPVVVSASGSF